MPAHGRLLPGIFPVPRFWVFPEARIWAVREAVAGLKANPGKPPFAARFTVGQLVDWHTSRDMPSPARVLVALAVAFGLRKKQRAQHHAALARRLRGEGLTADKIAARLGLSKRQVQRLYKEYAPNHGWTSAADVVAAIEADADHVPHQPVLQRLYDAARWFAEHGEPLPEPIWRACIIRLGLAASFMKDGRRFWRLTQDTVTALTGGILRVDAFDAATTTLAAARAEHRRSDAKGFQLYAPKTADALAIIANNADGRGGDEDSRDDIIREWAGRDDWKRAAWSKEIMTRWNRSPDLRPRAIRLVVEARAGRAADGTFEGCAPYSVGGLADALDVHESVVERWLEDRRRWDGDCAIQARRLG